MTFDEARQRWRDDVLVDESVTWFSDADGLALLLDAAMQIADGLRLIRADSASLTLAVSAQSFDVPADALAVQPLSVVINGVGLAPASLSVVREKQTLDDTRYPRYYHFDPGVGSTVQFGPPVSVAVAAGGLLVRYYQSYDTSLLDESDEVWGGVYPAFHHLVILLAGVTTFQGLELYQRASYFAQRYNEELQKFAAILGNTNVANLMVPPEQRGDAGRVSA